MILNEVNAAPSIFIFRWNIKKVSIFMQFTHAFMIGLRRHYFSNLLNFYAVCLYWVYKISVCAKFKQGGKNCNMSCAYSEVVVNCLKKSR